jgi:hypothetical protein
MHLSMSIANASIHNFQILDALGGVREGVTGWSTPRAPSAPSSGRTLARGRPIQRAAMGFATSASGMSVTTV